MAFPSSGTKKILTTISSIMACFYHRGIVQLVFGMESKFKKIMTSQGSNLDLSSENSVWVMTKILVFLFFLLWSFTIAGFFLEKLS